MPRKPKAGELDLGLAAPREGRVERRVRLAAQAAKQAELLEAADDGGVALALELARAVDAGARKPDPYAVASAGRELRALLVELRMVPSARFAGTGDALEALLEGLAEPDPRPSP